MLFNAAKFVGICYTPQKTNTLAIAKEGAAESWPSALRTRLSQSTRKGGKFQGERIRVRLEARGQTNPGDGCEQVGMEHGQPIAVSVPLRTHMGTWRGEELMNAVICRQEGWRGQEFGTLDTDQ